MRLINSQVKGWVIKLQRWPVLKHLPFLQITDRGEREHKKPREDQDELLASGPVGGVREKQLARLSYQQCGPVLYALSSWSGGSTLQSAPYIGDSISGFPVLQSAFPLGLFTLVQESIRTSCSPRAIKDPWPFLKMIFLENFCLLFLSPTSIFLLVIFPSLLCPNISSCEMEQSCTYKEHQWRRVNVFPAPLNWVSMALMSCGIYEAGFPCPSSSKKFYLWG